VICIEPGIISEIRKGVLRWFGQVERMPEERTVKKMFKNTTERKRSVGKPRKRWLDDDGNCLKKMEARGWRKVGNHRDARKLILKKNIIQRVW
jgi:hypothetical protein